MPENGYPLINQSSVLSWPAVKLYRHPHFVASAPAGRQTSREKSGKGRAI
jgi:hypothetical protein